MWSFQAVVTHVALISQSKIDPARFVCPAKPCKSNEIRIVDVDTYFWRGVDEEVLCSCVSHLVIVMSFSTCDACLHGVVCVCFDDWSSVRDSEFECG